MDFEALRRLIARQQRTLCCLWDEFDPCAEMEALKECKASEPPAAVWAKPCAARLQSVRFTVEPDELLIGRPIRPNRSPDELEAARTFLREHSPLRDCRNAGQTGHAEPDYTGLFQKGIAGLLAELRGKIAASDGAVRETCGSFTLVLEAFGAMISRAADTAETGGNRPVAALCRKIARRPPETFQEALQLIWFVMFAVQLGDSASLLGPGRLDRRLAQFYENDVKNGLLTYSHAVEYFALLYLYINATCPAGLAYAVMIDGGTVNPLSYAALEALRLSRLVYPSVGLCVTDATPPDLKQLAVDLIAEGLPNPAFFNDRLLRESMAYYGVPEAETGEYINSTCVEITPCGASNVWVASPYYNLCGILLEALKHPCDSFEALERQFYRLLGRAIRDGAAEQNRLRQYRREHWRRPLQSVFTRDCLTRGLDIECGGARYNCVECSFVRLANWVDSMVVIREEVFRRRNLSLSELTALLERNFAGRENLRLKFLNHYPKYGWNDPEADALIPPLIDFLRRECAGQRLSPDDSPYLPGLFCWEMHQRLGAVTGATPDGRPTGAPFADGAGPAQGREKSGPTAAVHSVCSWDHRFLLCGSAFNLKFPRSLLAGRAERNKLLALIDVFLEGGGFQTQINAVDDATLRRAIERPEEYADLVVRIGGYTDYFTRLSPGMQQEVLQRSEYAGL